MRYIMALLSIFLSSIAQVLLKKGANNTKNFGANLLLEIFKNKFIFIGLIFYALSALMWIRVLKEMKLSIAYPLVSLGYIFTLLFSFFFLKESIQWNQILGVGVIIVGVIILSR